MSGRGEQKFWTWLVLGLLGFFIGVPFVLTLLGTLTKKANKYASGVDWSRIGTLFVIGCVVLIVVGVLFAVLGRGSSGGSGQRDLASAQRELARAVEHARAEGELAVRNRRAENAQELAHMRAEFREGVAEEQGKWLTDAEVEEMRGE